MEFNKRVPPEGVCFVLGLEILDNMPHDRFYIDLKTGKFIEQTVVNVDVD